MFSQRPAIHALLAITALLTACAPRFYQRETLKLDHHDLDQFSIRYQSFEGCLLKRDVPVNYRVQRDRYRMTLDVHFGDDAHPATLDLGLTGEGQLDARFSGLSIAPAKTETEDGVSYRIDPGSMHDGSFVAHILRGTEELGVEAIRFERQSCRALSLGTGS